MMDWTCWPPVDRPYTW